jgi:hypothetical protein
MGPLFFFWGVSVLCFVFFRVAFVLCGAEGEAGPSLCSRMTKFCCCDGTVLLGGDSFCQAGRGDFKTRTP